MERLLISKETATKFLAAARKASDFIESTEQESEQGEQAAQQGRQAREPEKKKSKSKPLEKDRKKKSSGTKSKKSTSAKSAETKPSKQGSQNAVWTKDHTALFTRLVEFYTSRNPEKLADIAQLKRTVTRYVGREEKLFEKLANKYADPERNAPDGASFENEDTRQTPRNNVEEFADGESTHYGYAFLISLLTCGLGSLCFSCLRTPWVIYSVAIDRFMGKDDSFAIARSRNTSFAVFAAVCAVAPSLTLAIFAAELFAWTCRKCAPRRAESLGFGTGIEGMRLWIRLLAPTARKIYPKINATQSGASPEMMQSPVSSLMRILVAGVSWSTVILCLRGNMFLATFPTLFSVGFSIRCMANFGKTKSSRVVEIAHEPPSSADLGNN